MPGFVYILKDEEGKYYISSSINVGVRYKRHLSGSVFTTHRMKKPIIVFQQEFDTIQSAKKIESRLKKLKRKDYIDKIIKDGYIKMKI
jgi:predicted GIY-YIG superfamily endonuclease